MEYNNRIVSLNKCSIFLLAVLIFIVPVSATPSINISNGQISDVGGTTTLNLTLSGISNGICGYNITISLSNPGVAEIVSIEFPAWANLSNSSSLPSDSIWIKALDTKNETTIGDTNVLLATLTVRGDSQGSTEVIPIVNGLDDDNGSKIDTGITSGQLNVYVRGDLNNDGEVADAGDLVLMKRASIGEIPADYRYDLNNDGEVADAGDLVLMKRASIGEIIL